jgi:2-oxoisovalerate dehydrogenase E1 component
MQTKELLDLYERMVLVRRFEERASQLYRDSEVPGFVHLCIGQEASAVGVCAALEAGDVITSTHRGHGHCLARGLPPAEMFAELMGRQSGSCRGRGGSMHIADPDLGVFGANGIVAAGLPIAVGAATAARLRAEGRVVVAFFGDGAVAQGAFHESLNLAAVWGLPVAFVCENNHYAEFSAEASQHPAPLEERARGYGMTYLGGSGYDVEEVVGLVRPLVDRLRAGDGPALVELDTYRWHGHYEGDPERYRSAEEVQEHKARDPLALTRAALRSRGGEEDALAEVESRVADEIEQAVAQARAGAEPEPAALFDFVLAERPVTRETPVDDSGDEPIKMMDAVRMALEVSLEEDPDVLVAGIDVGAGGNVFGITRGLHARWPERVRDTPISETAIMGVGVGAAMAGMKPVVELMYLDFLGVCLDQLLNQAAKLRFMTGGRASPGLTVRTQFGAGRSSGSQHSQSLEALLAHVPGLTVVMPSTPADAYGLLRAAIADPNPVVFVEHRLIYGRKGPRPARDHVVPIGRASVVRTGRHLTVVTYSRMVHEVLAAAEILAGEGIQAEVIDLRTVMPFDRDTVLESVRKTSRLAVVHEAVVPFGVGAELAATVAADAFWHLDAPPRRIGAAFTPAPYAPSLERVWLPDVERIAAGLRETAET